MDKEEINLFHNESSYLLVHFFFSITALKAPSLAQRFGFPPASRYSTANNNPASKQKRQGGSQEEEGTDEGEDRRGAPQSFLEDFPFVLFAISSSFRSGVRYVEWRVDGTVPALKEQIATVTGVLSEQQRLICRGRVLKDDQLLSAYHVEDGHTLHLVARQPQQYPSAFNGFDGISEVSSTQDMPNHANQVSRTVVLETVNVGQGDIDPALLGRIVGSILSSFGATHAGFANLRADQRSERFPRSSADSEVSSSQNQSTNSSQRIGSNLQQNNFRFNSVASSGPHNLVEIPHSLTTLRQCLNHLKNEFRRQIPGPHVRDDTSGGDSCTVHHDERKSLYLNLQVEKLATELENHSSITDTLLRSNVQSSAIGTGILLQELGSLLLELGRTTMMLRMGQIPSEAIVNSGPAVFVSASGPNPVMVQPVPFFPAPSFGSRHMGSTNSAHALVNEGVGSASLPRSIDVQIHAGHPVPMPGSAQGGPGGSQQQQENTDLTSAPSGGFFLRQAVPTAGASSGRDYGVRVVPVRTVVAMPAGISNSQPNLPGNSVALLYPLLARARQQSSGNVDDASILQTSLQNQSSEAGQDAVPDSVRQILESYFRGGSMQEETQPPSSFQVVSVSSRIPTAPAENPDPIFVSNQQIAHDGLVERSSHVVDEQDVVEQANATSEEQESTPANTEVNESSIPVDDRAMLFANFLQHLVPLITQWTSSDGPNSSNLEAQRESSNDPSSSQHQRDPSEEPSTKRHKENELVKGF
ncbi:hypothetical protein HPP92_023531 [Vanilla planifolia]|uniref:Ubiquitin-like domain-containing protein n=1 Tax=Vanilla planifolia TaxID=51239 RepID=A0A835PN39_VANPL|nr:hypothetical protein HPP92_023531 [Vanilla planifolia]